MSLTLVATALTIVIGTGCKKSNDNGGSGSVTASVGTTSFSGSKTQGIYSTSAGEIGIASYNIQNKDTSGFILTIPYHSVVGKAFTSDTTNLEIDYVNPSGAGYAAFSFLGHASMTINQLDTVGHKINGVFTATAYNETNANDSVVISNGKFSLSYTVTN
jgi:hypothetical protein